MDNYNTNLLSRSAKSLRPKTHQQFVCPECGYIAFNHIACPICKNKLKLKKSTKKSL